MSCVSAEALSRGSFTHWAYSVEAYTAMQQWVQISWSNWLLLQFFKYLWGRQSHIDSTQPRPSWRNTAVAT